ncbi:MAG TPA: DUF2298 domain-containing protein, partial [Anaerolineales bacterium]|nr:DUF2298 domain-containing protein [Anaerolineales bacterium]
MTAFFAWYIIVTLLGWLTFPLAYRLFPALADRGYSLSRAAGLLIWGYVFWLFTSLGLTQNTIGGILFALLVLAGLSVWATAKSKSEIVDWIRSNRGLVITVEVLFVLAFAFLAFLRAGNPELDGTERPMELMFINAILRSPTFPPHDSWLSGYAISYYYFGYVMAALLAKLSNVPGSMAHNLMTALIFALAAVGSYGILYNLLSLLNPKSEIANRKSEPSSPDARLLLSALLAPLFLLLVSNLGGFLEVLHTQGVFWNSNPSNFWTWLDIKELRDPPGQPYQWIPNRYLWWWRSSRVISDFDLMHNPQEVIDEFPFFSFLLGDLHPHVLAIPFNLLGVALALNLFLGGWQGEANLFGLRLKISKVGFIASALALGGLAFLNTWDILPGAVLIVSAYVLSRVREEGWSWTRLEDVFAFGIPLGLFAFLLYLPFYFGFSSQAGGILPNLINPTRGAQLWVMFAPFFVPIFAYFLYLAFREKKTGNWLLSLLLVIGFTLLLWGLSWLIAWFAYLRDPGFAQNYLSSQGLTDSAQLFAASLSRRFISIGGLLTIIALLVPATALLSASYRQSEIENRKSDVQDLAPNFAFLLITVAALLVLAPEFVFLRDGFGTRMNTIFKFYYQAWLLFSLAAAFGAAVLLQKLRGAWDWAFRIGL